MTDENNLYYMRARFYSPEIKRFINQDVLLGNIAEGQSLNRFAFVTGNPVSFIDPFGLEKYCGQCAIGAYDCLFYGGNLCSNIKTFDDAQKILSDTLDEMKDKNVRGTDQFFHCLGTCRAKKATNDIESIRLLTNTKEYYDYFKNMFGLYGDGRLPHKEMLEDMQRDRDVNELGMSCSFTVSCTEWCRKPLDDLSEKRKIFMQDYLGDHD